MTVAEAIRTKRAVRHFALRALPDDTARRIVSRTQRGNSSGSPKELQLNVALSFGYPVDPGVLTASPRIGGRRPFEESVHFDRWG